MRTTLAALAIAAAAVFPVHLAGAPEAAAAPTGSASQSGSGSGDFLLRNLWCILTGNVQGSSAPIC